MFSGLVGSGLSGRELRAIQTIGRSQEQEGARLLCLVGGINRRVLLLQRLACKTILGIAQTCGAEQTCRHHTDAAHNGDGDRTRAREAIADHSEHRGPEESLTQRVDRQREDSADEGGDTAHQVEPYTSQNSADEQEPHWGDLQILLDEMSAEAQGEHKYRGVHEEDLAFLRSEDVAGDVLNPSVGSQLDSTHECVGHEENEEQPGSDGETGDDRHRSEDHSAHGVGDRRRKLKGGLEEKNQ